jgi:GT2 family glycosyltransferase/glycosyltransferase involved in cell wall biosynthesis
MVFVPASSNVLLERERHIRSLSKQLNERESYLAHLQPEFDTMAAWATKLDAELAESRAAYARLQAESSARIQQLHSQLLQSQSKAEQLGILWSKATRWKRATIFAALAPAEWAIGLLLLLAEFVCRAWRALAAHKAPSTKVSDCARCSVVIVSWEGKDLLAESLPPLLRALQVHGGNHEVIVLDNGSTDGTEAYVRAQFPGVRVVRSERNEYFGGGNNLAVREAKNDIVILLNNDMIVQEDFLAPLLQAFSDGDVFAVASQVFLADPLKPREETGKTRARFNGCDLDWRHEPITDADEQREYGPVFWGHGGAVAIDRYKFQLLGGFDRMYDPFYVEDADISYQAWKLGWRCLLAVKSKVIHKHRASTSRFGSEFITQVVRRNHELFIWKNFSDVGKLAQHFWRLPRQQMRISGVPGIGIRIELRSFLGAVQRVGWVLKSKLQRARWIVRSDADVFRLTDPHAENISSSEVDFSASDSSRQLGPGWYSRETVAERSYRWMGKEAIVYLRAPAESCELSLEGYVPSLTHYQAAGITLRVSCHGETLEFPLTEGSFERKYKFSDLKTGEAIQVELAVDKVILPQGSDRRILGLIWKRIALDTEMRSVGDREGRSRRVGSGSNEITLTENGTSDKLAITECRKILMVCAYLPCLGVHSGGNTMFNLIRTLSRRHRLTVLSFYEKESERERFVPLLTPYCEHLEVLYRGQSFENRNLLGLKPREIVYEFYHKRMERLVREYLLAASFDLLQCEFLQTGHFAHVDPAIPAVLTNHETLSLSYRNRFRSLAWGSREKLAAMVSWMRMLNYEEKLLHRFSAVVVLTRPEREFLTRYVPDVRVYDHPTGVDSDFFSPVVESPEPGTVVFVGNFRHAPNVGGVMWFLEKVWPKVRAAYPNPRFYIVGGNPPPNLADAHGRDGVIVTGWVEDVRPYVRGASVFVAPVFEGVGLRGKVLEAWSMEKPVVGTGLAFEALQASDGNTCFVADNSETFAARVCQLLQDGDLAARMGQQARDLVLSTFSWDAFGEVYDKIYRDILGTKSSPRAAISSTSVSMYTEG